MTTVTQKVSSVCPYCGVGCGLILESDGKRITKVSGNPEHASNFGRLCTKGSTSALALTDSGRLDAAFVKTERQQTLVKTPMSAAIQQVAKTLKSILEADGPDALGFYVSGQMSMESQYLINKLVKGFIRTNNLESNSRLCMASAGAGYKLSLGADAPPGAYDDFDHTDLFFVIGSNMADCHPILYLRMMDRIKAGAKLVVVDPRKTLTAEKAHLFLQIKPGTDLALLNGVLNWLFIHHHIDQDFIHRYTQGWDTMPAFLADYTPEAVAETTGLQVDDIVQLATLLANAPKFITCWTMGLNQSTHGTWSTNAICNLHLATGQICKTGSGPFSLTGQPNAMGGREMGYMGPGLPGQRSLLNESERHFVEEKWGIPQGSISTRLGKGTVDLFQRMADGHIKSCWIICTNPVATVPNRDIVINGLKRAQCVISQDAYLDTETNRYADILLPGALWAEAEGVMVNSERNITLMQKAIDPPGDALPDWQIIAQVACAMGFERDFTYASASDVFEEIKQFNNPLTDYDLRGINYTRLRQESVQWPCATPSTTARNPIRYLNVTPDLNVTPAKNKDEILDQFKFATQNGKAQFWPRPHLDPEEMPCEQFPFTLNTGRLQHQWHTLTKTGKISTLNKLNPGPFIEVHPKDAERLNIQPKMKVEIQSRRGLAVLPVVITDRVLPGSCFAPFHWNDVFGENLAINAVTSDRIDPISQQPELKVCAVKLTPIEEPIPDALSILNTIKSDSSPNSSMQQKNTHMINELISILSLSSVSPPLLTPQENTYLHGFMRGLQQSAAEMQGIPVLPPSAPLTETSRLWINGVLAGMFSRSTLPTPPHHDSANLISVLWASQTGNAEHLAQQFSEQLQLLGWQVSCQAMDECSIESLAKNQRVLLITSTFGDGDAPDNGQEFWQQLEQTPANSLMNVEFALLALGDSHYDQFCGHGKKLHQKLVELGAQSVIERMDCDTDYEIKAQAWFQAVQQKWPKLPVSTEHPINTPTSKAASTYNKQNPYLSRLIINQKLNGLGANKDVRCFGLDLGESGFSYEAGDALSVKPKNCPEYALELIQSLNVSADMLVLVGAHQKPLLNALIEDFEICRPNPDMLNWLAEIGKIEELKSLLSVEQRPALSEWLYGRQLVDILHEWPVRLDVQEFIAYLKPLQSRLYSIASSSKVFPKEVHLTVSAVRYARYRDGKKWRKGVASTYLADRAMDDQIPIFVQSNKQFRVPDDGKTPLIMVGPGTGIAPFRAFLQERRARGDTGKNWLFFGEQHQASDFYYRDELLTYQKEGLLTELSLAFSRDQTQKIYVQDRMREQGAQLWQWLEEGAYFCVCGDASKMAKDVDVTLRSIIQTQGGLDEAETAVYMRHMSQNKRYIKDVY